MMIVRRLLISRKPSLLKTLGANIEGCRTQYINTDVNILKVSNNLVLRENISHTTQDLLPRPLVILYEWLSAKPSAVKKYCELYHTRGYNVLCVKGKLSQFVRPQQGCRLAHEILDYLQDRRQNSSESYLVHAFSIGAFNHTLCLMTSTEDRVNYGWFRENIRGSIFDSIVIGSLDNMTKGMALSISESPFIHVIIRLLCDAYFKSQKRQTVAFYDNAVKYFKTNPVFVPTQYFYSEDDPMCETQAIKDLIEYWKTNYPEIDLYVTSWQNSVHAAHIKYHENKYKTDMIQFLTAVEKHLN